MPVYLSAGIALQLVVLLYDKHEDLKPIHQEMKQQYLKIKILFDKTPAIPFCYVSMNRIA